MIIIETHTKHIQSIFPANYVSERTHSVTAIQMSPGEKIVQPDWDSNPEHSEYHSTAISNP
jgi:hypothetical protein